MHMNFTNTDYYIYACIIYMNKFLQQHKARGGRLTPKSINRMVNLYQASRPYLQFSHLDTAIKNTF